MRIAHISDIHIRNFKYRDEYRAAFSDLYRKLEELEPDLVINTGDTVHSKLAVSPELFRDVTDHCVSVSRIAPYWIILGNHDLNLKNPDRLDAISPIVEALQGRDRPELTLLGPGPHCIWDADFVFWNYDIRGHQDFVVRDDRINIGLYHGSISGCSTDIGFTMEKGEAEVSKFSQMDFVLLGDIHKRQSFRDGRMWYAGSLIQQNYGEEPEKGFLLWDIRSKDDFEVTFHPVVAPTRFYTVSVPEDMDVSGIVVPVGSRVKVRFDGELTPSRRLELEKIVRDRFSPVEVITPDVSGGRPVQDLDIETLTVPRTEMMREHLLERGCPEDQVQGIIDLWDSLVKEVDQDATRGTTWSPRRISWDNMMNYGEGNVIDLTRLRGLVGIFAPNASGKSSIFDIIQQACFDKMSKEVPRNIDLINDNKDQATMVLEFDAGERPHRITRTIERVTYGQRKLAETKQWGKTVLDFVRDDESMNGTSRPETEREIRRIVGSFEDFALTTMVSQNPVFGLPGGGDIINCKETDRRKILFRFLDLDVYERVHQLCKDELKGIIGGLKGQDRDVLEARLEDAEQELLVRQAELTSARRELAEVTARREAKSAELTQLEASDLLQGAVNITRLEDRATVAEKGWKRAVEAHERAGKALEEAESGLLELTSSPPKRPEMDLDELAKLMDDVRRRYDASNIEASRKRDSLMRGEKALVTLEGIPCGSKFPNCKFIREAHEFLSQRDAMEAALRMLEPATGQLKDELDALEGYRVMHSEAREWELAVDRAKLRLERCVVVHSTAQDLRDETLSESLEANAKLREALETFDPAVGQRIDGCKLELELLTSSVAAESRRVEALLRSLGAIDAKKQGVEAELTKLDEMKSLAGSYERLAELTGKTGLPYRILTRVLPVINDEIAKILGGVVGFSVFFEDDPESQSVGLFIRYGDYRSRPLALGSGAEKFIASIAIRAALLNVSSLPKTDVLIIDEGFGKLDPEHLESLQKMFEYLRGAFGTVFIVSHVDSMRDIVDHSIEITSQDGYAHVEVT